MDLQQSFRSVGRELGMEHVSAEFFPYRELKHSWRSNGNGMEVRVSDYLDSAPREVLDSLAWQVLSLACGKQCPRGRDDIYRRYSRSRELWQEKKGEYLRRAENLSLESLGKHRDLRTVFRYVNSTYFSGCVSMPELAWVSESPAKRLGFYFEPLDLLAVNRFLDSSKVPRYVLEFVMYHELLHHVESMKNGRTGPLRHSKDFRCRERQFSSYMDAEAWLRRIVAQHRRSKR